MDKSQHLHNHLIHDHNLRLIAVRIDNNFMFEDYLHLLPKVSKEKIMQYHFKKDQLRSFTSEWLKYYYLADYLKIKPNEINIESTTYGKPFLANNPQHVVFNISHSGEYVIIAIARNVRLGIDIEQIDHKINPAELAPHVFSPSEQSLINSDIHNFFKLWTKKEALLKMSGEGFINDNYLSTNLDLEEYQYINLPEIVSDLFLTSFEQNYFIALAIIDKA